MMDAAEIEEWAEKYNGSYEDEIRAIEHNLTERFSEQDYVTKDQLREVVSWKLENQPGRRDRYIGWIDEVPDEFIRRVSEAAFLVDDPKVQLKTLNSIPGIGYATATVILTFYDPSNYGVGDQYLVDALLGEDRPMRVTDYTKLLDELRDRNPGDFDLRTVEKAYYRRYMVKNDL